MNCNVRADFPTPPGPTIITLWTGNSPLPLLFDISAVPCKNKEAKEPQERRRERMKETVESEVESPVTAIGHQ